MSGNPAVAVIVPVHNGARHLATCLAALVRQHVPPPEIIVVDDGSTDESAAIARTFPCRLLVQERRGVAAARNAGGRAATGDLLLFVDADVVLPPHWLQCCLANFAAAPAVAVMQGWYDTVADQDGWFARGMAMRHAALMHWLFAGRERISVCNLESGCLALRREVFTRCGWFAEQFRASGGEEHEFGWRIMPHYPVWYFANLAARHRYGGLRTTLTKVCRRSAVFLRLLAEHHRLRSLLADQRASVIVDDYLAAAGLVLVAGAIPAWWWNGVAAAGGAATGLLALAASQARFIALAWRRHGWRAAWTVATVNLILTPPKIVGGLAGMAVTVAGGTAVKRC